MQVGTPREIYEFHAKPLRRRLRRHHQLVRRHGMRGPVASGDGAQHGSGCDLAVPAEPARLRIAPLVGGFLADHVGWRWVFLVNLPIGAAALAIVAGVLPASVGRSEGRTKPLDVAGITLLTGAIGLVLVGLSQHAQVAAWSDPRTGGLVLAGLALLVAFVQVERRAASPIIPLSLFADRRTAALLAAGATGAFGLFAGVFLLPRYFQGVRDVSATHSGLLIYPLLIGLIIGVNLAAAMIMRRGEYRTPILTGFGAARARRARVRDVRRVDAGLAGLLFMALMGLGVGPAFSGLQIALQRTVKPAQIGAAMGTLILLRQVGGAVALAGAETIYTSGSIPPRPPAPACSSSRSSARSWPRPRCSPSPAARRASRCRAGVGARRRARHDALREREAGQGLPVRRRTRRAEPVAPVRGARGRGRGGRRADRLARRPAGRQAPAEPAVRSYRLVAGTPSGWPEFHAILRERRDEIEGVMLERRTQTNEATRCALMLPLLAQLPQPLALLEVGASAGLCLLPDRYGYDYDGHALGDGPPVLRPTSRTTLPLPHALPRDRWRAGLDLNPIDVTDDDQVALAGAADLARDGVPAGDPARGASRSPGGTRRGSSRATSRPATSTTSPPRRRRTRRS